MNYITYRRFRGRGLGGVFNLPFGTVCREQNGYLFSPDGRVICAAASENGWNHFRPNTPEGAHRQAAVDRLKKFYQSPRGSGCLQEDLYAQKLEPWQNDYWLHLLRTLDTRQLEELYQLRIGGEIHV